MHRITAEKLAQAVSLVQASDFDAWITFVRETSGGSDPVLPLLIDGALTWQSALIVTRGGATIAVVGNFDADPLIACGDWSEVVPYVQGIRDPLIKVLERHVHSERPRLAVNTSVNDVKADGLTHGMYILLNEYFRDTRFEDTPAGGEEIVMALRSQKTPSEIAAMRSAIRQTENLFAEIGSFAKVGKSEKEVFDFTQGLMSERGLGYAWDATNNPIVNSGSESMVGHGIPSATIKIEEGHVFHVDLGVVRDGYSSDLQRSWFVGDQPTGDTIDAFHAVHSAISAGAALLKPGVRGWEVDETARNTLTSFGYPEYLHALGHQVGRVAHDGGAILGPRWERYGRTPDLPIQEREVYTVELGVMVEGRGYLGLEEMLVVTKDGIEWLSTRQNDLWSLSG